MLCVDDFMTGKCSCISETEYTNKKTQMQQRIKDIISILKSNIKCDKDELRQELSILSNQFSKLLRKIHYTEQKMIPFNIQFSEYKKKLDEEEKIRKQQELEKEKDLPIWNRSITENIEAPLVKKITKISLGKK
jgi:hypothetical protein